MRSVRHLSLVANLPLHANQRIKLIKDHLGTWWGNQTSSATATFLIASPEDRTVYSSEGCKVHTTLSSNVGLGLKLAGVKLIIS